MRLLSRLRSIVNGGQKKADTDKYRWKKLKDEDSLTDMIRCIGMERSGSVGLTMIIKDDSDWIATVQNLRDPIEVLRVFVWFNQNLIFGDPYYLDLENALFYAAEEALKLYPRVEREYLRDIT